jgi:16S rRNA A1518/A1519 N6-dimethyltransferase RsmA/KsgA/DIM1 with predicted DNA glycosylase/AP lyase activity
VFVDLVKRSFSQRRKMMWKLLKAAWPEEELERAFAEVGLSQKVRAEEVTVEQFARLAELLRLRSAEKNFRPSELDG